MQGANSAKIIGYTIPNAICRLLLAFIVQTKDNHVPWEKKAIITNCYCIQTCNLKTTESQGFNNAFQGNAEMAQIKLPLFCERYSVQ